MKKKEVEISTSAKAIGSTEVVDVYLHDDARRYRWLRQQKGLVLASDNTIWKKPNGLDTYVSSHKLYANNVQYAPAPTLDELIDKAMGIQV